MLARSIRAGGGRPACRHAASSAARRLAADGSSPPIQSTGGRAGAPSAAAAAASAAESSLACLAGRRTPTSAVRCSSVLTKSHSFSASENELGNFAAHHQELISAYPQRIPLRSPPSLQLMGPPSNYLANPHPSRSMMLSRSYHSMVPSSSVTIARRTSRETRSAILLADPHASAAFEETMTRIIMRALFSTNPSPDVNTDDNGEKDAAKSASTPMAAKAVSAADAKLNDNSAEQQQPPAKTVTERKKPKAPKEFVVQHATATDALVSFVKSVPDKTKDLLLAAAKTLASLLAKTPGVLWYYVTHPLEFRDKLIELKEAAKKEAHHYWMGSKLLAADLRTARQMLKRSMQGTPLTRRERKQLLRTVSDVFRLVPMSIFVLIPFMEFALPFALKLFPNMLPSTFQDSLKSEENMKRELKMRLTMAEFFQETLQDLAQEQKKRASSKQTSKEEEEADCVQEKKEKTAQSFLAFLEKARNGEMLPAEEIIKYASYFQDELTLDNMPRMQLVNFCRYMSIPPYGSDNVLRFQLRHRMRMLQEDDQRILWEGIDSLTKMELREACQERGMRSTGLSKEAYKFALQQWLDLSVNRNVPISLLIMSRTFFLQEEMTSQASPVDEETKSVAGLADAISGLDKDVVNEVVLSVASSEEKSSDPDVVKIKLEVLEHQNELIEEEKKEREEAAAKKAAKEQEKAKALSEASDDSAASDGQPQEEIEEATSEPSHANIKVDPPTASETASGDAEASQEDFSSDDETDLSNDEEEEKGLSTEEIDAISQLVSPNPVSSEREELERIKAAMLEDDEELTAEAVKAKLEEALDEIKDGDEQPVQMHVEPLGPDAAPGGPMSIDEADAKVAETIEKMDVAVDAEAASVTKISMTGDVDRDANEEIEEEGEEEEASSSGDERLDKAVDRLKYRVESMVGRLEAQLTDVEAKIGDKLHLLDKDLDETISTEEMSDVIQQVLKRKLSAEEAEAIAADMDADKDGFLTVAELSKWVDNNKVIKLLEEGREGEIDKMIERRKKKLLRAMQKAENEDEAHDEAASKEA
mmetsp:Transcript_14511/g.41763  ORF Transcript_14511/g.41763 Transcript_14511/m.41763 type:complete len:1046 (+) Transcript_14511:61-3198(+)